MRALLVVALVGCLGCDYMQARQAPAAPKYSEEHQKRLIEIAELDSTIDLAIAKSDRDAIEFAQFWVETCQRTYNAAKGAAELKETGDALTEAKNDLRKVLVEIAKRRHREHASP